MPSWRSSAGASTRPRSHAASARNSSRGTPARASPPGASGAATIGVGCPRLFPSFFQTSQWAPCSSVTGRGSMSPTPLHTSGPSSRYGPRRCADEATATQRFPLRPSAA